MKKNIITLMLLYCFTTVAAQVNTYTTNQFNADTCCWRLLASTKQYSQAGNLIVQYLKTNTTISNTHSLNWHAGQMFAMAGNNHLAIKYFKKTYSFITKLFGDADGKQWYYYAKGTVAFIDRDKNKLERILTKWQTKYPSSKNYIGLKKLYDNWNKTYENATK